MRKLTIAVMTAAVVVVPAQAHSPKERDKPSTTHRNGHSHAKSHRCDVRAVGFNAQGKLVSAALTQTAGAGTAKRSDDRYDGTVTVDVKRANHRAPKGEQTYTLDDDRVKFYDADHNGTPDEPKAGDRVKVKGKITRLPRRCDASGFTPTINVRRVELRQAKS